MIEFYCNKCGGKFSVPGDQVGRKGRCPKCKKVIFIPDARKPDSSPQQDNPSGSQNDPRYSAYDLSLFDIPQEMEIIEESIAQQQMLDESFPGFQEPDEGMDTEGKEVKDLTMYKLPWIIDIFLYPFNLAGVIHLIGSWLLIFLLCPLVMATVGLGTEYAPLVYLFPVSYVLYYFTECIRVSAQGHCRAPDFWMHPTDSDKWDCISQLFVVVGSIAVCFCPVAVYYIAAERSDLVYWLLLACGGFFFPMVLIAVVLFDSFSALNPLLIVRSILSTFTPYCGLIITLFVGLYICLRINSRFYNFHPMPIVPFFLRATQLYMVFIAAGLLGRFYHRYEKKLNWEV